MEYAEAFLSDYLSTDTDELLSEQPTPPWSDSPSVIDSDVSADDEASVDDGASLSLQQTPLQIASPVTESDVDTNAEEVVVPAHVDQAGIGRMACAYRPGDPEYPAVVSDRESGTQPGVFAVSLGHRPRNYSYWTCSRCSSVTDLTPAHHHFVRHQIKRKALKCPACEFSDVVVEYFVQHLQVSICRNFNCSLKDFLPVYLHVD